MHFELEWQEPEAPTYLCPSVCTAILALSKGMEGAWWRGRGCEGGCVPACILPHISQLLTKPRPPNQGLASGCQTHADVSRETGYPPLRTRPSCCVSFDVLSRRGG